MGTELIARGLILSEASTAESWNLTHPDVVRAVHAEYLAAGAEVLYTNTFGLGRDRTRDKAAVAKAAVDHARSSGARRIWGSLGPTLSTTPRRAIAESAELLARAGVEAIVLETFFDPTELEAAIPAAQSTCLPVIACITVSPGNTGLETPTGTPLDHMIRILARHQPDAVGLNCSLDADRMLPALKRLASAVRLPCLAKPQAKQSQKCLAPKNSETPELFARLALGLVQGGATAIGACCGAGPTAISALRSAIDAQWPERAAS